MKQLHDRIHIEDSLAAIGTSLREASINFNNLLYETHEDGRDIFQDSVEYQIQFAFEQLLFLMEALGFESSYQDVKDLYGEAKKDLSKHEPTIDEPILTWPRYIHRHIRILKNIFGIQPALKLLKIDLCNMLKQAAYSITNPKIYKTPPQEERDVHNRIENILKPVFGDLLTEPTLTKQIKSFRPDTGLPSQHTLIEYKFAETNQHIKKIADEILTDTRGYASKDWKRFIFAIYETRPLRAEQDWKQLFDQCGMGKEFEVIVLTGTLPKTP